MTAEITLLHTRPDMAPPGSTFALDMDYPAEIERLCAYIAKTVARDLLRRGVVLGVSGGIDSAVCIALAARSLGPGRVRALLMPEREGSDAGMERAERLCRSLGVRYVVEDIDRTLEAAGCYRRRDAAIRQMLPAYGTGWRHKIVLRRAADHDGLPFFYLVAQSPSGAQVTQRMPRDVYLQVVAATNLKQRTRKMVEYHHADELNYAVLGTPNRLEYELGFFVRGGDGLADLKPIAHLYKTQVYRLAEFLGVPEEIRTRPPTTDTYALPQSQEEFYFSLPWDKMDLCLYGKTNGLPPEAVADAVGLSPEDVERVYRDIDAKRRVADILHLGPQLVVDAPDLARR